ncbi:MAG: tRNA lysidine(34) synthetase TilS [bacterium]|nr:tRNA lysidine(34) synthetase TilS [Acidimicrobiia bacterium]MCY4650096.1 tRNA lysidine(34) synthetase TilS [bacterium]
MVTETRRLDHLAAVLSDRVEFPRGPLVIALSGGADSAAAAWLANRTSRVCRAIHVNHRLPDSSHLAGSARSISRCLGMELSEVVVREETDRTEDALRTARYRALTENSGPREVVITAHTADDQSETVLQNLLRGAGLDGLAGIPAHRGRFHRPLLGVWRSETRELATLAGLPWVDDPQNDDPRYLRNRIRRSLIPQLEAEYQPRLREGLVRLSALASADLAYLDEEASRIRVAISPDGWPQISCSGLVGLPRPISSRVVRRALRMVRGPHGGAAAEVQRVLDVAHGTTSRTELGGGVIVTRLGDRLLVAGGG